MEPTCVPIRELDAVALARMRRGLAGAVMIINIAGYGLALSLVPPLIWFAANQHYSWVLCAALLTGIVIGISLLKSGISQGKAWALTVFLSLILFPFFLSTFKIAANAIAEGVDPLIAFSALVWHIILGAILYSFVVPVLPTAVRVGWTLKRLVKQTSLNTNFSVLKQRETLRNVIRRDLRLLASKLPGRQRAAWASIHKLFGFVLLFVITLLSAMALFFPDIFKLEKLAILAGDTDDVFKLIDRSIGRAQQNVGTVFLFLAPLLTIPFFLLVKARRLEALDAADLRKVDPRPPVLLLRPFADDALRFRRRIEKRGPLNRVYDAFAFLAGRSYTFEQFIAEETMVHGPLIAIGEPGEQLPPLGAGRAYYSNLEWRDAVKKLMEEAGLIFVITGSTKNLAWEMKIIVDRGYLPKTILIIPPDERRSLLRRWEGFCEPLRLEALGEVLSRVDPSHTLLVRFGADGMVDVVAGTIEQRLVEWARMVLLAAGGLASRAIGRELGCAGGVVSEWGRIRRDRWSYEAALLLARPEPPEWPQVEERVPAGVRLVPKSLMIPAASSTALGPRSAR